MGLELDFQNECKKFDEIEKLSNSLYNEISAAKERILQSLLDAMLIQDVVFNRITMIHKGWGVSTPQDVYLDYGTENQKLICTFWLQMKDNLLELKFESYFPIGN